MNITEPESLPTPPITLPPTYGIPTTLVDCTDVLTRWGFNCRIHSVLAKPGEWSSILILPIGPLIRERIPYPYTGDDGMVEVYIDVTTGVEPNYPA